MIISILKCFCFVGACLSLMVSAWCVRNLAEDTDVQIKSGLVLIATEYAFVAWFLFCLWG